LEKPALKSSHNQYRLARLNGRKTLGENITAVTRETKGALYKLSENELLRRLLKQGG